MTMRPFRSRRIAQRPVEELGCNVRRTFRPRRCLGSSVYVQ
jgi:hypothetical protein